MHDAVLPHHEMSDVMIFYRTSSFRFQTQDGVFLELELELKIPERNWNGTGNLKFTKRTERNGTGDFVEKPGTGTEELKFLSSNALHVYPVISK